MIKKIQICNRINFTSNANEVIRAVLNSLFIYLFFYKKISRAQAQAQRRNQAKA